MRIEYWNDNGYIGEDDTDDISAVLLKERTAACKKFRMIKQNEYNDNLVCLYAIHHKTKNEYVSIFVGGKVLTDEELIDLGNGDKGKDLYIIR